MKLARTLAAVAVLGATALAAPSAQATVVERTVVRGPVVCSPIHCVQKKVVTKWGGGLPVVTTLRRTEPVESRTSNVPGRVSHWSAWRIVSAY